MRHGMGRPQGAQHEEAAVRKIDDPGHAKDQRQARGHQKQGGGVAQAIEQLQRECIESQTKPLNSNGCALFNPVGEVLRLHTGGLEGVDQGRLVGIAERHAAHHHLVVARTHVRQDDFGKTIPRRLGAGVQAA